MVYAVATQDSVLLYDTQQKTPICVVSNLHCATFTDLAWYETLPQALDPRANRIIGRMMDLPCSFRRRMASALPFRSHLGS